MSEEVTGPMADDAPRGSAGSPALPIVGDAELDPLGNDLSNVLDSVDIPLIIVDLQMKVRRLTPAVRKIARFVPQDVGRPLDDLKLKIDVDDLPGRVRDVIGGLAPKEWEVRGPEGCWFRMIIRPYRTSHNRLDGAVLSFVDVTALRALEAERVQLLEAEEQARLDAERANRARDSFIATLAHELRTPLSAMLMSAQFLRRTATADDRILKASASIERAARSQAQLIDDLLDVSRIVSGKLLLDLAPVDLAATVRDAVHGARPSADAKALNLTLDIGPGIGFVCGDPARLLQVVSNLLGNAIKFTPHGGRVSVALARVDGRAQITVGDTGIGIAPEVLPLLFNKFVQADSSVTGTHGGLGLGLSIVRHIVEVHGGTVQAESPGEGHGSTFRVTLPPGSAHGTGPGAAAVVPRGIEGVRVLLVEDDADTREAFVTMLRDLGAVVRDAASATDAIAALEEFSPHVILSDVAMSGEDGFGFIERVRRRGPERGGQVPAAAITALASEEHRQRALQAGFQMHVAKPIDAARLVAVVSRLADWRPSGVAGTPK